MDTLTRRGRVQTRGGDGPGVGADTALAPAPSGPASALGARFGGHPLAVALLVAFVGGLVLGAVVVGLGLLVTHVLSTGAVDRWDSAVSRWFVDRRTPTLNAVTRWGSDLGATLTIVGIAVVSAIVLAVRRLWRAVELIAIALVVEVSIFLMAALVVDRPRPRVPRLDVSPPTASYPSGHTAASIALYVTLAIVVTALTSSRFLHALVWLAAVVLPVVVALSRLYRGMHHATDVLGSVVLGLGAVLIAVLAVDAAAAADDAAAGSGRAS